jgi:hypothetical protein
LLTSKDADVFFLDSTKIAMTKFFIITILLSSSVLHAQSLVTDLNFQNWLSNNFPDAVLIIDDDFYIDGTYESIQQTEYVYLGFQDISDLTGIEAFSNLTILDCSYNQIVSLGDLPLSLEELICNDNNLTSISQIPSNVWILNCTNNFLQTLPMLPEGLELLNCRNNALIELPELPMMLKALFCEKNYLTQLPQLPSSLLELNCSENLLTGLPTIPASVYYVNCTYNQITALPSLSSFYGSFFCDFNQISSIPALSQNIFEFGCSNNQLTELPSLPNNLLYLGCAWNQLTVLPDLPQGLLSLWCAYNNITCFPFFPNSLIEPASVLIAGNPHTCLPNYVPGMLFQDFNYPLCVENDLENNPFGCASTVSIEYLDRNLTIYPNPFYSSLKIELESNIEYLKIWSISGVHIITHSNINQQSIDVFLDQLEPGVYLIDISTKDTLIQRKITKL